MVYNPSLFSDQELRTAGELIQTTLARRKSASDALRRVAEDFVRSQYDPSHPLPEDIEDSRHLQALATKNDRGTLTIKEAQAVLELLETKNPLITDMGDKRWVEAD